MKGMELPVGELDRMSDIDVEEGDKRVAAEALSVKSSKSIQSPTHAEIADYFEERRLESNLL